MMTKIYRNLTLLLIILSAQLALVGCGLFNPGREISNVDKVFHARQAHTTAMNVLTPMISTGQISDPSTLRVLRSLNDEVTEDLDLAETYANAGKTEILNVVLARIEEKLAKLEAEAARRRTTTQPTSYLEERKWERSSLSSVLYAQPKLESPAWSRLPKNLVRVRT